MTVTDNDLHVLYAKLGLGEGEGEEYREAVYAVSGGLDLDRPVQELLNTVAGLAKGVGVKWQDLLTDAITFRNACLEEDEQEAQRNIN